MNNYIIIYQSPSKPSLSLLKKKICDELGALDYFESSTGEEIYQLPETVQYIFSDKSRRELFEAIKNISNQLGIEISIIILEISGRLWYNLPKL
ncbi:hypothetical protein GVX76_10480 [[Haemophilus] felis]|nr:hypothetical protein [[Haemophilus] felis]